jgi:hypothetical protein
VLWFCCQDLIRHPVEYANTSKRSTEPNRCVGANGNASTQTYSFLNFVFSLTNAPPPLALPRECAPDRATRSRSSKPRGPKRRLSSSTVSARLGRIPVGSWLFAVTRPRVTGISGPPVARTATAPARATVSPHERPDSACMGTRASTARASPKFSPRPVSRRIEPFAPPLLDLTSNVKESWNCTNVMGHKGRQSN